MTLSAFAWNIVRTYTGRRYSFAGTLGTASNLVMCVSAADNDYVGVTGTFLRTPSLRRLDPRAGAAVGGHAGPVARRSGPQPSRESRSP